MLRLASVVVSIIVLAGCYEDNHASCELEENQDNPACQSGGTGGPCKSSTDCKDGNSPICDTAAVNPTCVQCTESDHALCTGTTPLCKNDTCAACTQDSECGTGGLCLPNGACVASDNIIHAANPGLPTACGTSLAPCSLTAALAAVDATKNVIKLEGAGPFTPPASATNYTVSANVTIDARGATLHKKDDGPILSINAGTTATIFGGKVEGATNGDGILCSGTNSTLTLDGTTIDTIEKSAINATAGCKLTVTNATISNSSKKGGISVAAIIAGGDSVTLSRSRFSMNKGGGINVTNGTFVIVGNVFLNNGDPAGTAGAVLINTGADMTNRIEFNSISGNHAPLGGNAPGVQCNAGSDPIARNNIIWNNNDNNGPQIAGTCKHAYSNIGMMSVVGGFNDAGNNQSMDPMFTADLHLMPTSMQVRKADPNAKLDGVAALDIDGQPRVMPADLGADQLPRP